MASLMASTIVGSMPLACTAARRIGSAAATTDLPRAIGALTCARATCVPSDEDDDAAAARDCGAVFSRGVVFSTTVESTISPAAAAACATRTDGSLVMPRTCGGVHAPGEN